MARGLQYIPVHPLSNVTIETLDNVSNVWHCGVTCGVIVTHIENSMRDNLLILHTG